MTVFNQGTGYLEKVVYDKDNAIIQWNSDYPFKKDQIVHYKEKLYKSLEDENQGFEPDAYPDRWEVLYPRIIRNIISNLDEGLETTLDNADVWESLGNTLTSQAGSNYIDIDNNIITYTGNKDTTLVLTSTFQLYIDNAEDTDIDIGLFENGVERSDYRMSTMITQNGKRSSVAGVAVLDGVTNGDEIEFKIRADKTKTIEIRPSILVTGGNFDR